MSSSARRLSCRSTGGSEVPLSNTYSRSKPSRVGMSSTSSRTDRPGFEVSVKQPGSVGQLVAHLRFPSSSSPAQRPDRRTKTVIQSEVHIDAAGVGDERPAVRVGEAAEALGPVAGRGRTSAGEISSSSRQELTNCCFAFARRPRRAASRSREDRQ